MPHRDAVLELHRQRGELFSRGLYGVYAFPIVAPLCPLERPLSINELKEAAKKIREGACEQGGVFEGRGTAAVPFVDGCCFFGNELSIAAPCLENNVPSWFGKLGKNFEKIILCRALISTDEHPPQISNTKISFSAAALANMIVQPLGQKFSFQWKIGRLVWLEKRNAAIPHSIKNPRGRAAGYFFCRGNFLYVWGLLP